MAHGTVIRNVYRSVVGICRLVVVVLVTALTSVRRVVIVAVVASCTIRGNSSMCSIEHVIIIVNAKGSRTPARIGGMACGTIRWERQIHVIRVG